MLYYGVMKLQKILVKRDSSPALEDKIMIKELDLELINEDKAKLDEIAKFISSIRNFRYDILQIESNSILEEYIKEKHMKAVASAIQASLDLESEMNGFYHILLGNRATIEKLMYFQNQVFKNSPDKLAELDMYNGYTTDWLTPTIES